MKKLTSQTKRLSIPFMGYQLPFAIPQSTTNTFNSLYGIQRSPQSTVALQVILSIPFMGYYEQYVVNLLRNFTFQFPLWDTSD